MTVYSVYDRLPPPRRHYSDPVTWYWVYCLTYGDNPGEWRMGYPYQASETSPYKFLVVDEGRLSECKPTHWAELTMPPHPETDREYNRARGYIVTPGISPMDLIDKIKRDISGLPE